MKRIIAMAVTVMLFIPMMSAQPGQKPKDGNDWKERVRAEKIAYITSALDLTADEAQAFWPVYNEYSDAKIQANIAVRQAYKALEEALDAGKDVEAKLKAYTEALDNDAASETEAMKAYCKVLPVEKVAKLYVSEEKYRCEKINKLHAGDKRPGPADNQRPGRQERQRNPEAPCNPDCAAPAQAK